MAQNPAAEAVHEETAHEGTEALPALSAVALNGASCAWSQRRIWSAMSWRRSVASHIELSTLLAPGTDPHAYQLAPADRQLLEDADVILINGLGLEEGMLPVLDELDNSVPVVAVSIGHRDD